MITLLVAFLLAVVGTARAVRLLIFDAYPPVAALRRWWWNATVAKGGWRKDWHLVLVGETPDRPGCPFCAAPYVAALVLAAGLFARIWTPDLSTFAGWCWVLAVWATLSYLAAMLVVRDEPADA